MHAEQTNLSRLLTGTKSFIIPQFQRHYKWKRKQHEDLFTDVIDQYQDPDVISGDIPQHEGHFLGSIVLHQTPGPASTVTGYWVIDGQQRLITITTLIAAIRDLRLSIEPDWDRNEYDSQYLRNPFSKDRPYRVIPGATDHSDYISTVYDGKPKGLVGDAYKYFISELTDLHNENTLDFEVLERALLFRLVMVEINTSGDDNINQIFHTINHAGMKLSAVDLIRNHAFMQFAGADATKAYESLWKPLEEQFDERTLEDYIFAQLVRHNSRVSRKDLFQPFTQWITQEAKTNFAGSAADAARDILMLLRDEAPLYKAVEDPRTNAFSNWSAELRGIITDLADWDSTPAKPLVLEILSRFNSGKITSADASQALRYLQSFLVRRALCGIATNNLNRQLTPIPNQLNDGPVAGQFQTLLSHESRYWPSDDEVLQKAPLTPLYSAIKSRQIKLILDKLNRELNPAEPVATDDLQVEHIMPQSLDGKWQLYLLDNGVSVEDAKARTHNLGNLTLTGQNQRLARHLIEGKWEIFKESNLPLNRELTGLKRWLPEDIDKRSDTLASHAIQIWPGGQASLFEGTGSSPRVESDFFNVENVISSLPAEEWTTIDAIAELISMGKPTNIENELRDLGYPVFNHNGVTYVPGDKKFSELPDDLPDDILDAKELSSIVQD